MSKIQLKELEDDASADKAVTGITSSLDKLASAITNVKDFSRVVEAIVKWLQKKKGSQLSSLESNQNYKMLMSYLNKMQSDLDNKPATGTKENPAMVKPAAGTKENPAMVKPAV